MLGMTEGTYLDPTFEVENQAEEADDASLNEATTQNAKLKIENQLLQSKIKELAETNGI